VKKLKWAIVATFGVASLGVLWTADFSDQETSAHAAAMPLSTQATGPAELPFAVDKPAAANSRQQSSNSALAANMTPQARQLPDQPREIALPRLDPDQLAKLVEQDRRESGKSGQPSREGIVRDVPDSARKMDVANLPWQPVADGGMLTHFDVSSSDAQAIRINLDVSSNNQPLFVSFTDKAGNTTEPIGWGELAGAALGGWSPLLDGDRVTVNVFSPGGKPAQPALLAVTQVAHI
jgi:hypothetical protein